VDAIVILEQRVEEARRYLLLLESQLRETRREINSLLVNSSIDSKLFTEDFAPLVGEINIRAKKSLIYTSPGVFRDVKSMAGDSRSYPTFTSNGSVTATNQESLPKEVQLLDGGQFTIIFVFMVLHALYLLVDFVVEIR
jgi:hypothetical protein